jgi:beta-lactamase class C
MRRFKILIITTLLFFALFALMALSVDNTLPASELENETVSTLIQKNILAEAKRVRLFKKRRQELEVALNNYFETAIASGDIVGAGVSIVKGDSILISDGFGKRDIDAKDMVDGETVFRLGSLSKGFAGVLAADLKEEGKLSWEDKVSDYLPDFQLGDRKNTDKIKLAHILSHTSGTPYHSFTNLVEAGIPMKKIAGRFNEVSPISEPGAMYSYQNAMFALCGEIMKIATGNDITVSLDKRFFKPLNMQTASTDYETLIRQQNVAKPHSKQRNGWSSRKLTNSYDNAVAAGGINASALDMAKWMRFLLGHNSKVMNESSIAEAFEPQIEINIGRKYYKRWPGHVSSHYAFGWRIHKFEDESSGEKTTVWHHGGSVNRFRNEIAIYPETDLGICVLLNSNSKLASTVIPDLHKIVAEIYKETSPKLPQAPASTVSLSFD